MAGSTTLQYRILPVPGWPLHYNGHDEDDNGKTQSLLMWCQAARTRSNLESAQNVPESGTGGAKKRGALIFARGLDWLNLIYISLAAIVCLTSWGTIFYKHTLESSRREYRVVFCDFAKYYVCGKLAFSPDRFRVYDKAVQDDYTVRYAFGDPKTAEEFIHYPPMDFPLMAPLSTLPMEQSYLAFCLLGSTLLIAGTFLLGRATKFLARPTIMIFYWLAVFGSVPMLRTFVLGQTSVFLTGIIAIYLFALLKNRPLLAGAALALTSIKPQYTLFLAVPALVQRRYKLIGCAALVELVMILAAVASVGWQNVIDYPKIVLHSEQNVALAGAFVAEMVNARGLLANLADDSIAVKIAAALAVFAWLGLAYLWHKFAPSQSKSESIDTNSTTGLLLAATVLFALTFSPHTHLYDACFNALPILVAGRTSMVSAIRDEKGMTMRLFASLLFLYPFVGWNIMVFGPGMGPAKTVPFAIYNLVLCILAVRAILSRPQTQS
jgi:Glycosyltransferase family 87